jgi:DNA-binding NarL/FixJ family response regulator
MCGQDLIRELRKADSPPRILAMTGYVLAKELRALRSEGHLHTIHKPLDVNTLARGVRKALDAIIVDSEAVAIPA